MRSQPFWFDEALELEGIEARASLNHDLVTEIGIVGGGYTGLWTAINIKLKSPSKDVIVIEKDLCGQGASGRNGGCMLTFSTKFKTLQKFFGRDEALRLVTESESAVVEIEEFCKHHQIDAEVNVDGVLYTATNEAQKSSLLAPLSQLEKENLNTWQLQSQSQLNQVTGSERHISGIYSPIGGSLHPGKLVRGLARVAESLGVKIYENTPLLRFSGKSPIKIETNKATIKTQKLILATNAWTPGLIKYFQRSIVLVSSDMMITQPQQEALNCAGLDHGMAIADSKIFVHYFRTSQSGRMMLGKGGNYFSFANRMTNRFDQPSRIEPSLKTAFERFFPSLESNVARSWNGASDRSVNGLPFFGRLNESPNVCYGLGYSGNGVVQSYLGGKFLSSLALDADDDWSRSPMANGNFQRFPIEPFRTWGANIVKRAIRAKERAEDKGQQANWWQNQFAQFATSAGKSDK